MAGWKKLLAAVLIWGLCMGTAHAESLLSVSVQEFAALVAADGREIIPPGEYDDIFCVIDGSRYALGTSTEAGMRYALCDQNGNLLTEALFAMLQASGDAVVFRQDGLYGAMNADGEVLIEPLYTQLTAGENGWLAMTADPFDEEADEIFYLNEAGEARSTGVWSDEGLSALSDGRMPFQNPWTEKFGYVDGMGNIVIGAQFDSAGCFENGLARTSADGRLGMIGTDGVWRIPARYDYLDAGDGVIVALEGRERFVVYDSSCAERFSVEGTQLEAALAGACPILLEGEALRVYSPDGKVLIETDSRSTVTEGTNGQLILTEGDWGASCVSLVGSDGLKSERTDQHLIPLDEGRYAFIRMNAAKYYSEALDEIRWSCDYDSLRFGMMDGAGNEILPAEYREIRALGGQRYLAVDDEKMDIVDRDGCTVWRFWRE